MTKNDIISIIKHCHKHSVRRLAIEGLELEFPDDASRTPVIGSKEAAAADQKDLAAAQNEVLDQNLDELMVIDFEAYEQGLLDRSLAANDKAAQVQRS